MSRSPLASARHRRRWPVLRVALAAVVVAMTAAACNPTPPPPPPPNPPYWNPGLVATSTMRGPFVRLTWNATNGGNPAASYQISLGTYTGTVVALVPASVRDCIVTGLAANTTYTFVVTARDAQQNWSGPLSGTKGNRTAPAITTGAQAAPGSLWCHPDVDADGLPDTWETDDGTYNSMTDTGSDPGAVDTDDDGITDRDEVLGRPGLNLIAMGARPTHKDLLIETDWIAGASCAIQPTSTRLAAMVTAFANAPITNPDGVGGIKVIVDYGQGGAFTGGNQVPDIVGPVDGVFDQEDVNDPPFVATKVAHFDPVRKGIFHYSITQDDWRSTAETGGDDTYVDGACNQGNAMLYASNLMHEIGHNLGLGHGGMTPPDGPASYCEAYIGCIQPRGINWKPNYVSVMNYFYQDGMDASCRKHIPTGQPRWLDYSTGWRAPLDENSLDETVGICNGVPFDYNNNYETDALPYSADITDDQFRTPLHDHDDWGHIDDIGLAGFVIDPDTIAD